MSAEQAPPAPSPPPGPALTSQARQQPDPLAMKLTRGTSCVLCQQRKVRCDRNKPCANCVKARVECRVAAQVPPRRRKKRLQEKDLIERLKRYESLLTEHGVKFDAIGHDLRGDGPQLDDVDELENDFEGLRTSPEASASPSVSSQTGRPNGSWLSLHKEFRAGEQMLHDSSDEEIDGSTIHRAFDSMFSNQDGFPFIIGGRAQPVTDAHPSTIHIFQLWQVYIDNVNPLLKLTHVPTTQGQIIEATSRLDRAPKNMEALMFAIYLMAITSLAEADVRMMFGEPKKELLGRYFASLQQALLNAGFMRNNDLLCLQAYLLYLYAVRWFVDPRQLFCLIGVAVRIAQRLGLHRDPGGFGLPPFEVEQRRRLWWTIVGFDRRTGEMTGSTVTALSSGCDCKMPLNVNDSDLHVESKEMPAPHGGQTEMLFALTRTEFAMAVAGNSSRDSPKTNNLDRASPSSQGSGPKPPAPTIRIAGQDCPPYTLDGFSAHMEGTYLSQCDTKIPLHFFTLIMTRQSLCKMRIISFLVRMHNAEAMPLKEIEREGLLLQATQMIEYDNMIHSSENLQPFKWYAMYYFPFPAYIFLMHDLRNRISGPVVERAWKAIAVNHDLRGVFNNTHSPMQSSFGNFVKAWDAHEAAQRGNGKQVEPPRFIATLRERAVKRRKARAENHRQDPSLETAPVEFPRSQGCGPGPDGSAGAAMPMPPSVDQFMASAGLAQSMAPGAAPAHETGEMDWSYLVSGYRDMGSLQGFSSFGGLGNPMARGMDGFGGWNMYGNG